MSKDGIRIGQTLYAINGEPVVVVALTDIELVVEYKGRNHTRKIGIIGEKLFVEKPLQSHSNVEKSDSKCVDGQKATESVHDTQSDERLCNRCKHCISGMCFGKREICSDFIAVPTISPEKRKYWPKYGDATYIRIHGRGRKT